MTWSLCTGVAESVLELGAWENVQGGMCGGNAVCPEDTLESAQAVTQASSVCINSVTRH